MSVQRQEDNQPPLNWSDTMKINMLIGMALVAGLALIWSCEATTEPTNNGPTISSITADPASLPLGGETAITAVASDPDNDTILYTWSATDGAITGSGATVTWTAPEVAGTYTITLVIDDAHDSTATGTVDVAVIVVDLQSVAVTTGPTLDGAGDDAAWDSAQEFVVTAGASASYTNAFGQVDVSLKSVHTSTDVYVLASWTDPSATENANRKEWSYAADAWSRASTNEDRLYFMFDGGDNGTEGANCATMCHQPSAGSMATTGGGHVDVWHWKGSRTNPIGLADDKWWDGTGRGSDSKTISAYKDNITPSGNFPLYAGPKDANGRIIIAAGGSTADLTLFDSTDVALQANTYPGEYLNANAYGSGESRHDVETVGVYSGGVWTVEFKRALDTGHTDDVVFAAGDTTKFSMAITDNSGGSHSGAGVLDLILKP